MYETPQKNSRRQHNQLQELTDVTLVGKFTDPAKYYVFTIVLPLLLILACHFAIYCYKGSSFLSSQRPQNKLLSVLSYVPANFFDAVVVSAVVTIYSCTIVYLNSREPGVDPPSPIDWREKRYYSSVCGSRMGFSYMMSFGIGFVTFVFSLFPSVVLG